SIESGVRFVNGRTPARAACLDKMAEVWNCCALEFHAPEKYRHFPRRLCARRDFFAFSKCRLTVSAPASDLHAEQRRGFLFTKRRLHRRSGGRIESRTNKRACAGVFVHLAANRTGARGCEKTRG